MPLRVVCLDEDETLCRLVERASRRLGMEKCMLTLYATTDIAKASEIAQSHNMKVDEQTAILFLSSDTALLYVRRDELCEEVVAHELAHAYLDLCLRLLVNVVPDVVLVSRSLRVSREVADYYTRLVIAMREYAEYLRKALTEILTEALVLKHYDVSPIAKFFTDRFSEKVRGLAQDLALANRDCVVALSEKLYTLTREEILRVLVALAMATLCAGIASFMSRVADFFEKLDDPVLTPILLALPRHPSRFDLYLFLRDLVYEVLVPELRAAVRESGADNVLRLGTDVALRREGDYRVVNVVVKLRLKLWDQLRETLKT
jgi:hypothetical protein